MQLIVPTARGVSRGTWLCRTRPSPETAGGLDRARGEAPRRAARLVSDESRARHRRVQRRRRRRGGAGRRRGASRTSRFRGGADPVRARRAGTSSASCRARPPTPSCMRRGGAGRGPRGAAAGGAVSRGEGCATSFRRSATSSVWCAWASRRRRARGSRSGSSMRWRREVAFASALETRPGARARAHRGRGGRSAPGAAACARGEA